MLSMNPMKETGKKKIKSNVKRYLSCFLILFLVVCSLHIYGSSVLAATSGASSDVDSVIDSIPGLAAGKTAMLSSIETHLGNQSSVRCTMFKVGQYWQGSLVRYKCQCFLTLGNLFYVNGNLYSDAESDVLYYTAFSNASTTSESTFVFAGTSNLMFGDKELFLVVSPNSEILDPFTNSDSVCWTSDECFINPDLIYRNLDISDYVPDTRVLNATEVELYGTKYIEVVTSDVYLTDSSTIASVTVQGFSNNVSFSYTFSRNQFIDVTVDNPYAFFYLDPNDIPYSGVELAYLTYRSDSSLWLPGDKTIPVNFDFTDGSITVINNYNDISYITSSDTDPYWDNGNLVYPYCSLYIADIYNHEYLYDNTGVLIQNFDIRILITGASGPTLSLVGSNHEDTIFLYENNYDVIIHCPDEFFFNYCYSLQYSDSDSLPWHRCYEYTGPVPPGPESILDFSLAVKNLPSSFSIGGTPPLYSSQNCSLILTSNFLRKRTIAALGEIDDRLLEFETNLLKDDGALASIQTKLANLYIQDNDYYNTVIPWIRNVNTLVNDVRLNEYFPKIVISLSSIDMLINQIDSDTSYLPSIDTSLSSILSSLSGLSSMGSDLASVKSAVQSSDGTLSNLYIHSFEYLGFLGQIEDHTELTDYRLQSIYTYLTTDLIDAIEKSTNVILDVVLPEFDFEYIGQDWDKFGDFVSDITVEFQGLDFTGFDTFTTDSRNFLNGLIDSNGLSPGFLNHLGDSYDFSDSKLDDFGWE